MSLEKPEERIAELERRLEIDSQTSSKPPSSDGLNKKGKKRTKSLRPKGKRQTGGQKDRPGKTLEQVLEPDLLVNHQISSPKHLPRSR